MIRVKSFVMYNAPDGNLGDMGLLGYLLKDYAEVLGELFFQHQLSEVFVGDQHVARARLTSQFHTIFG